MNYLNISKILLAGLLFSLFISNQVQALTQYPTITNSARYYNYRPTYNPYGRYYNPYSYQNRYYNGFNRGYNKFYNPFNNSYTKPTEKQLKRLWQRNRIKNNIYSFLGRNNGYVGHRIYNGRYNPSSNGTLTGFSTPITNNALNVIPNYSSANTNLNNLNNSTDSYYSPTNQMKLIQTPVNGQEFYFNDGRFYKDLHGLDSSTGVKIIYD